MSKIGVAGLNIDYYVNICYTFFDFVKDYLRGNKMDWHLILGYLIFFVYTLAIMLVGVYLEKKTNISKTICRKLTHIASAFIWVICHLFFGYSIHWLIVNGISTLLMGLVIFNKNIKIFSRDDSKKSVGLFYFCLSTFIVAVVSYLISEEFYLYAGITYFALALGDGFAPIVARVMKDKNKIVKEGKTLFGTISVYLVTFISTLVFSNIFDMNLSISFILSIAGLTCITEFYGVKGLDNLFIEFCVFGYLLLYHYGFVSLPLEIVLITSPLLAILAIGSKSMTPAAGVSAFLLFTLVGFFGEGFIPVGFIFLLFTLSTIVGIVSKKLDKKDGSEHKKESRKAKQIIAVGLFGIVALGLYYFTKQEIFNYIFYLSFVEQFVDSMASDIGRLTKKKNINIITFKPVEKGISGGVSLLGTICALLGSLILMLIPFMFKVISFKYYIAISLLAFIGNIIDSILGATLQALYKCKKCNKLIENSNGCCGEVELIKGFKIIDNTAVNYLASLLTCLLGLILLVI